MSAPRSIRADAEGFIPSFNQCEKKWRTNWKMIDFCAKKQIKGVGDFTKATAGLPDKSKIELESFFFG